MSIDIIFLHHILRIPYNHGIIYFVFDNLGDEYDIVSQNPSYMHIDITKRSY